MRKGIEKSTGRLVAIKVTSFEGLDLEIGRDTREITFMISSDSPYLVRYYNYYFYDETLYIILEYLPGRSLIDIVCSILI